MNFLTVLPKEYEGNSKELTTIPCDIPLDATTIQLNNNNISRIGMQDFINFTQTISIGLSINSIAQIEDHAFQTLTQLEELYLASNLLTVIRKNTFSNLVSCNLLYLGKNSISMIEEGSFSHLKNLTDLDLSQNKLTSLPDKLIVGTSLYYLQIHGNRIETLQATALQGHRQIAVSFSHFRQPTQFWRCDRKLCWLFSELENESILTLVWGRAYYIQCQNGNVTEMSFHEILNYLSCKRIPNQRKTEKRQETGSFIFHGSVIGNNNCQTIQRRQTSSSLLRGENIILSFFCTFRVFFQTPHSKSPCLTLRPQAQVHKF